MFEVRTLGKKDLPEMEEMYVKSIRLNNKGFWQNLEDFKNIKDFVVDAQNDGGNFYGLFVDGKIIGMGGYINEGDKKAQVCKLHLNKDYQGNGLGKLLLNTIESDAKIKAYKKLVLHVSGTQEAAISLYKRNGYVVTDVKPLQVKNENETVDTVSVHMVKKLQD